MEWIKRKRIVRFLMPSVLFLAGACAEVNNNKVEIKIRRPPPIQLSQQFGLSTAPSDVADFDCFAVNIVGEGIPSLMPLRASETRYYGMLAFRDSCTYPGVTSDMFPLPAPGDTEIISLDVPSGSDRIAQIIGIDTDIGGTCDQEGPFGHIVANSPDPDIEFHGLYEVAQSAPFDNFSPTTVSMTNEYDVNDLRDVKCALGFEGTWYRECKAVSETPILSREIVFDAQGSVYLWFQLDYTSNDCTPGTEWAESFQAGLYALRGTLPDPNGPIVLIDGFTIDVTIEPMNGNATSFNSSSICGFSSGWADDVARNVTGTSCDDGDTFTIAQRRGPKLFLEYDNYSSTPQARPTVITADPFDEVPE